MTVRPFHFLVAAVAVARPVPGHRASTQPQTLVQAELVKNHVRSARPNRISLQGQVTNPLRPDLCWSRQHQVVFGLHRPNAPVVSGLRQFRSHT